MDRSDDNSDGVSDPPTVCTGPPKLVRDAISHFPSAVPSLAPGGGVLLPDPPALPMPQKLRWPPRPMSPRNYPAAFARPVSGALAETPITYVRAPLILDTLPPPAAVQARSVVMAPVPAAPAPPVAPHDFAPLMRASPARGPTGVIPVGITERSLVPSADKPLFDRIKPLAIRLARYAAYAVAGWLVLVVTLIFAYRFINPPMSSLMLQQRIAGQDVTQTWVPMESISPQVVRAVLLSEDGRFCQHWGVDFAAMQEAIERSGGGIPRGASTISMQVTKNLFLWPSKSYLRKAIEIPLTWLIELIWPKRRIMEVYLNIAEWGPGVFGVEAASRVHFSKAASRLNEREAAQLAVALPNPYARDPGSPGPQTRRLASDIQDRMRGAYPSQTACVLPSRRGE
ncbi:MAG: monofunctional biosynthetic peptidoglycan transglycosylase [Hyphomicrobium sp.]